MKLKTMMACLLALLLAVPGGDMYAQTRKKSGGSGVIPWQSYRR